MMAQLLNRFKRRSTDLVASELHDEETFYLAFGRDLRRCRSSLIIESPFITTRRVTALLPTLWRLISHGVTITVNTRPLGEQDDYMRLSAEGGIKLLQSIGVDVLFTGGHHRKLVVIDKKILWEGSLNVLSQCNSCEIMRRIESVILAKQMLHFIRIDKYLTK